MEFLEHLAQAVERTGHTVTRGKSFLMVEPINLKIEAEIGGRNEHNVNGTYSVVLAISIKATHEQMFPNGVLDCLAGVGRSDEEAFSYAAHAWTEGIFWTIHEILVPTETEGYPVLKLEMLTRNQDTGEEFGWKLYIGALQAAGEFAGHTDLDQTILVKKLLNEISSITVEKKLFWIKIYIAKLSETDIHGDCWLNNQDWIEGLNALYWFTEEWQDITSYGAMKQFVIIKPCEVGEIDSIDQIRQSLPPLEE
jgi:hypothetical protein